MLLRHRWRWLVNRPELTQPYLALGLRLRLAHAHDRRPHLARWPHHWHWPHVASPNPASSL